MKVRRGLDEACPSCGVPPGRWCDAPAKCDTRWRELITRHDQMHADWGRRHASALLRAGGLFRAVRDAEGDA